MAATSCGSGIDPGWEHSNRNENLNIPDFITYLSTSFFSLVNTVSISESSFWACSFVFQPENLKIKITCLLLKNVLI